MPNHSGINSGIPIKNFDNLSANQFTFDKAFFMSNLNPLII